MYMTCCSSTKFFFQNTPLFAFKTNGFGDNRCCFSPPHKANLKSECTKIYKKTYLCNVQACVEAIPQCINEGNVDHGKIGFQNNGICQLL